MKLNEMISQLTALRDSDGDAGEMEVVLKTDAEYRVASIDFELKHFGMEICIRGAIK